MPIIRHVKNQTNKTKQILHTVLVIHNIELTLNMPSSRFSKFFFLHDELAILQLSDILQLHGNTEKWELRNILEATLKLIY